jgi:hypothetical protein
MTYTDDQGRPEIVPGAWFGSGRATWRHLQADPAGDDAGEATHPAGAPALQDPDQGRMTSDANVFPAPTSPV